jgi:CBS domain-containing protein
MAVIDAKNVLRGLTVAEAMRRQVIAVHAEAPLEKIIRFAFKYKVNAILVQDPQQHALGVVTKTDLMGAYYAGLPLDTPGKAVMVGPPLFCHQGDSLDQALDLMRQHRIHRLYVYDEDPRLAVGVLAYPDIVGMLYRFCTRCNRSILRRKRADTDANLAEYLRVREVMTPTVETLDSGASLVEIMTALAATRLAAILLVDREGRPAGVVSKTDLILAYKHRLPPETPGERIMSAPVRTCSQETYLALALRDMIFWDLYRLFVIHPEDHHLVGVLSLSDAARFRSGTCRACLVSRIAV